MVPDYGCFLRKGLGGAQEEIRKRRRPLSSAERNFYEAMEITVRGLSAYVGRYADLAQALLDAMAGGKGEGRDRHILPEPTPARTPGDPGLDARDGVLAGASLDDYEPGQLRHIVAACRNLAWGPACSFPEALQMMWFLMCFVDYDSFGRADQYLLPSYKISKSQGRTDKEALLWMKYTWIKIEESGAILNMTIGGREMAASGSQPAANPLTYLALRATRQMGFRSPNLSLRIRSSDPPELWQEAHTSTSTGQGLPALYNDDLIVNMPSSMRT